MTTRRLSWFAAAVTLLTLFVMFVFNDSVSSAPRDLSGNSSAPGNSLKLFLWPC